MKHSLLLVLAITTALFSPTTSAQITSAPTETAKVLAQMTFQGLALAVKQDQRSSKAFRECVAKAHASQFNRAAQDSLSRVFTAAEIAQLDHFNASPTGRRYNQYNYDAFQKLHGAEVANPTRLSREDVTFLRKFESTDLGRRYMAQLETGPKASDDPLNVAISKLIKTCRSGS